MTPLSLEEIIDAKKAKEEELSKPKFLTKAERAQLALERRQKEAEEKRRQMDELRNVFIVFDVLYLKCILVLHTGIYSSVLGKLSRFYRNISCSRMNF